MVLAKYQIKVLPGQKLCGNCCKIFNADVDRLQLVSVTESPIILFEDPPVTNQESGDSFDLRTCGGVSESTKTEECYCTPQEDRLNNLNSVLTLISLSPFKFIDHHREAKITYGQNKYASICKFLKQKIENIFGYEIEELDPQASAKKNYFEDLMENLKVNINSSTYSDQISMLTLAPEFWTNKEKTDYFDVTLHRAKLSRDLKSSYGILAPYKKILDQKFPVEVENRVRKFYCDDKEVNSRIMPGLKDRVRIAKNQFE